MLVTGAAGCFLSVPDLEPAPVAGRYQLVLTPRMNECNLEGLSPSGGMPLTLGLTLSQDGATVSGEPEPAIGFLLFLSVGVAKFSGTITGRDLRLDLAGQNDAMNKDGCAFRLDLHLTARAVQGQLQDGHLRWQPRLTSPPSAACAYLKTCQTVEDFGGVQLRDGDGGTPP